METSRGGKPIPQAHPTNHARVQSLPVKRHTDGDANGFGDGSQLNVLKPTPPSVIPVEFPWFPCRYPILYSQETKSLPNFGFRIQR